MEINCSKTKKVVAYAEGKIHPMQTVTRLTTYVIQVGIKLGKSQTNIHCKDIRTAHVMKTILKRIFMGSFRSLLLHVPLAR